MKTRALLPALALLPLCAAGDTRPGAAAPPLTLSYLLQAPDGAAATWQSLQGNVVVLEFWATWCPGCREQIPHLNSLQEQFQSRSVRFLSLTDEEPALVRRFLKDYPISGWIGLDSNGETFAAYGIFGRPSTVVVDAKGIVHWVGSPSGLTPALLEDALAGKPAPSRQAGAPAPKLQALPEPLYRLELRPAGPVSVRPVSVTGYSPGAQSGEAGKKWELWGVGFARLLSECYSVPEDRIEGLRADDTRYDVAVAAPNLTEPRRRELLARILSDAFQLKAHKANRDTGVYVLRTLPGVEPRLRRSSGNSSRWGNPGQMTAVAVPPAGLARILARALGKTVIDETRLTGQFDFELKWNPGNPQSLLESVRLQLGLGLSPAQRPLEYLVIDSAELPRFW